jgi:hypothetical protein
MKKRSELRFPSARVKKIMQTDEEVGKIAQATPVLVSKAVELFLQDLCQKTFQIAEQTANKKGSGGKTLTPAHLKECVSLHEEFDFLHETVSRGAADGGAHAAEEDVGNGEPSRRQVENLAEESKPKQGRKREQGLSESKDDTRTGSMNLSKVKSEATAEGLHAAADACAPPASKKAKIQSQKSARSQVKAESEDAGSRRGRDFDLNMEATEMPPVKTEVDKEAETVPVELELDVHLEELPPVNVGSVAAQNVEEDDYDCD